MENLLCAVGTMVSDQSPFFMGLKVGVIDNVVIQQYMGERDKLNEKNQVGRRDRVIRLE